MFKSLLTVLSLVFILAGALPVSGADFDSALEEARTAYQDDENLEALNSLRQAMFSVWDDIPLTVVEPTLITDQTSYTPRDNNVYSAGDPIYIVCQVLGYTIKRGDNVNHINIATDFYVLDEKGEKILMGKEDFGSFDLTSPFPNTEFKLDLKYRLNAPAGKYIIRTRLRDKNSDKSTEFTKDIVIE